MVRGFLITEGTGFRVEEVYPVRKKVLSKFSNRVDMRKEKFHRLRFLSSHELFTHLFFC